MRRMAPRSRQRGHPTAVRRIRRTLSAHAPARAADQLRRQGFGVAPTFARDLGRRAVWFDPSSFARRFALVPHYRLHAHPGVRVAVVDGSAILYDEPWWIGERPTLARVADVASLPPVELLHAPGVEFDPAHELEVVLPPAARPTKPPPRIRIGEIKGIRSYAAAVRQLSARGLAEGNDAVVVYDDIGNVHMQVFRPDATGVRRIVWDGRLGRVRKLPPHVPGHFRFGNLIEEQVRQMVSRWTGQRFVKHRPNASGPDLVARPRTR